MKKRLFFLFCCFAFLLSGCGGSSEPADAVNYGAVDTTALSKEDSETKQVAAYSATSAETAAATEANVVVDGMNYFTFRRDTKTYQNEEGQDLLWVTFTDPDFYSPDTQLHDWVNRILDAICKSEQKLGMDLHDYAQEELEALGKDFYSFSHYFTLGVGRHDTKVASVLALSSMYSGGSYPTNVQTARNLDMKELKVLTLDDVLLEDSAADLVQMVKDAVREKFASVGEEGLYSDYSDTIENTLAYGNMTSHWYFNETGLVVFFNQYELGPYAAGIIKAELPYDTLEGILRPEYIPQGYTGVASDVSVSKSEPRDDEICQISFGEGETLYISVVGKASHVQLSMVYFAEDIPVGESMLFSANFLDETTTIALQGDWFDTETVYGVEYSDEEGGPTVIYSTSAEVWAEVS